MNQQTEYRLQMKDLFSNISSASELETRLTMMKRLPRGLKIWSQIVFLAGEMTHLISKNDRIIQNHRELKDGCTVLHIDESIGRIRKIEVDGFIAIVPSKYKGIFRLLCVSDSLFWNRLGIKFIQRSYPLLVPIFFRQPELRQVLLTFEKSISQRFNLAVTELAMKEKRMSERKKSNGKNVFDSERRWTDSSIQKIFDEAEERRQWFKSIRLELFPKNGIQTVATIRVTKYGLVAQDHLYDLSANYLFENLEQIGYSRTELFARRGIKERDYSPAKPVSINYPVDIFHEKLNVRKLTTVLKAYPNSSKAVYHGNPYLHMSLADFIDGSSFEIWVLSPRRIIIVPQAKASVPSFEKLVSHIFDHFKEGQAAEYSNG